jgi:excisionase family DNA binding protein
MSDDESIFMTVEKVADRWKCHPNTVRKYCQVGMLKAHYIAGAWKIPRYALHEYEERTCNVR